MNFREMRAKLIATYGRFVFFPDDPEIPKVISTRAFTHLVIEKENIVVHSLKPLEEQLEEEIKEDYDVIYEPPKLEGTYYISPNAKTRNIQFKWLNGEKILKKALRKPFEEELELIRGFSKSIDVALNRVWDKIEIGMTAETLRSLIDCELIKAGTEEFAYPTIVAIGKHSLKPYPSTEGTVEEGKIVYIDSAPSKNGYPLNFSRVIFTEEREDWINKLERINKIYSRISKLSAGNSCEEADMIIRELGNFPHYSMVPSGGFYQPYAPGNCILEENMLATVVPSIYIPDGVIRVKRNIIVRKSGLEFLV